MKKWLLNNIALKITAILLAIITWVYVRGEIRSQEEIESRIFPALEVKVLGSVPPLKDRPWHVRVEPNKIDVTVSGPRSRINRVHPENVSIFVDISNLKAGEEYHLPVKAHLPPAIEAELNVNTCKVTLEETGVKR
jgi:YbbR domain-containing protein